MFVRFESTLRDPDTGRRFGLFHAARIICDNRETPAYIVERIEEQRDWFAANLERPNRFARSKKPNAHEVALSWFRPTARECIVRARTMAALVSEQTFSVAMITTSKPGVIVYEDELQIVAVPFRR